MAKTIKASKTTKAPKVIKIPKTVWALGESQDLIVNGVAVVERPIYYFPEDLDRAIQVGYINSDYAEPLMKLLSKANK